MPELARDAWQELFRLAADPGDDKPVKSALRDVRDRAAFHYSDKKALVNGFVAHFCTDEPSEINDAAYWCVGATMAMTRFHYADAAAQRFMLLSGSNRDVKSIPDEISELADFVNNALRFLIEGFLRRRAEPATGRDGSNVVADGENLR
jgi:hypothetical protein